MLAKAAWQSTQLDCVHIHCCGNGRLGFRPDGGSLLNSAKVSKTLLPHHSAPRLGSVCPNAGLNPWAAATRHPWRGAANPASCRVTHEFKPAFGQRGLTGRLRSRSQADQEQDQERLASHHGYSAAIAGRPALSGFVTGNRFTYRASGSTLSCRTPSQNSAAASENSGIAPSATGRCRWYSSGWPGCRIGRCRPGPSLAPSGRSR